MDGAPPAAAILNAFFFASFFILVAISLLAAPVSRLSNNEL